VSPSKNDTNKPKESPPSSSAASPGQVTVRRLKYEMCKNWRETNTCRYGDKCLFAHGKHELTKSGDEKSQSSDQTTKLLDEIKLVQIEKFQTPVKESLFTTDEQINVLESTQAASSAPSIQRLKTWDK